jgi:phage shock protein PspC (stress-responsive transcriptional regulator)
MKKALQISIARTLFTIEEDAYARLESYLTSVKKHFESTPGSTEIIADIESRIAEQLLEGKEKIVTIEQIETILASMGRVEDFDDDTQSSDTPKSAPSLAGKKLYRDTDHAMIAGVCAGIAAYMGWEALWVRLAFVLFTLFNGVGIVLYIILWVIVPAAKTASQKLEMTGSPITIETLSETVRERIDEIKKDERGTFARILSIPAQLIAGISNSLSHIAPAFRIVLGLVLTLGAGAALAGLCIATGILLSGTIMLDGGVPLADMFPGYRYALVMIAGVAVVFIPTLAAFFAGLSLMRKKALMPTFVSTLLICAWFVAISISGYAVAKIINHYEFDGAPLVIGESTELPTEQVEQQ